MFCPEDRFQLVGMFFAVEEPFDVLPRNAFWVIFDTGNSSSTLAESAVTAVADAVSDAAALVSSSSCAKASADCSSLASSA